MPGLRFNGLNNYVTLTNSGLDLTTQGTVEAWFKCSGTNGTNQMIVDRNPNYGYTIFLDSAGNLQGRFTQTGSTTSPKTYADGLWHHAVVTAQSGTTIMYVDGAQVNSTTFTGSATQSLTTYIGSRSGTQFFFSGSIAAARIYSRALSASEVAANYAGTVTRTGLAGEWLFNEGQGTTALDTSGNGNNGTITGATWVVKASQQGLTFNGLGTDYIGLPVGLPSLFNFGTGDLTFELRCSLGEIPITNKVIFGDDSSTSTPWIGIINGGYIQFALSGTNFVSSSPQPLNAPIHVVAMRLSGTMYVYINGVLAGTPTNYTTAVSLSNNAAIGRFGSSLNKTFYFKGQVSSFRIYNRGLSASEVSANYAGNVTRSGLVGEWLMQAGQGTTAFDTSGNGNHGTITGATWAVKSKARFNLLGVDGNCDSLTGWNNGNSTTILTLDSANAKYGINAIKATINTGGTVASAWWNTKPISLVGGKYYILAADVKNGTSSNVRLFLDDSSGSVLVASPLLSGTTYTTAYVKYATPSVGAKVTVEAISAGTPGQYGYVDGIRLYEISADEYNRIDVDPSWTGGANISALFPYVEAATPLSTLPAVNKTVRTGMRFNGLTDKITAPNVNLNASGTLMAWIQPGTPTSPTFYQGIIGNIDFNIDRNGYIMCVNNSVLELETGSATALQRVFGTTNLRDGKWHFVCVTWDSSVMRAYTDGVKEGEVTQTVIPTNATLPLAIGYGNNYPSQFVGPMNGIRMYNRALTQTEITAAYAGTVTRTGLVGEWLLDHRYNGYALDTAQGATTVVGNLLPGLDTGTWTVDSHAVVNGPYSLTLNATLANQITNSPNIRVVPNRDYILSVGIGTLATHQVYLREFDASGAQIGSTKSVTSAQGATNATIIFTSSPTTNYIDVRLLSGAAGTFTFNQFMFTTIDGTSAAFAPQTGNHGAVYGAIPAIRRATLKPKKNLLPTFDSGKWTIDAAYTVSGNTLSANISTGYKNITIVIPNIKPSTTYMISGMSNKVGVSARSNSSSGTLLFNLDGTYTGSYTFTTAADTTSLYIGLANAGAATGLISISDPQLELGSTQTTFESYTLVPDIKQVLPVLASSTAAAPVAPAADTTAPAAPTGLTATAVSSSQINLSWTAATDNVGVTGYDVYRGGNLIGSTTGATAYNDTGLTASTSYSYTVKAKDAAGNVSAASSSASATTQSAADTTPPSVPSSLTATAISTTQINLSWSASTDNVAVTGYDVYRGASLIGSTTGATTYSDTGLTPSTAYSYTVKAKDAAGNISAASSAASATTQAMGNLVLQSNWEQGSFSEAGTGSAVTKSASTTRLRTINPVSITGGTSYTFSVQSGYKIMMITLDSSGNELDYVDWQTLPYIITVNASAVSAVFRVAFTDDSVITTTAISAAMPRLELTSRTTVPYQGASFNGTSQYAEDGVIAWSGGFTVDMYIYHDASVNQDWNRIIQRGNDDGAGFAIRRYSTGVIFTNATTAPDNAYVDLASGWHRLQFRYTGSVQEIWVDGTKATTSSVSDAPGSVGSQFTVGKKTGAAEYYWSGSMKNLRFWNRSLTDTEMGQLNGGTAISSGLKGEWFTKAFSGTTLSDTSGSGNTLTLYGGLGMDTGVPTTNLAVEYRLGDGSGQTLADYSANALNATLGSSTSVETADPAWTSYGLSFSNAELDVTNIPYNAALDFSASSSVTIIALVKLTNVASVQTYERRNGSLGWLQLRNRAGQPGNILCHNDAGTSVSANTARNQVSDTWDVLFGRINAGTMQARFNKEAWGTSATASGTYTFASVGATLAPRDGNIAYFAYYNRALSDAECDKVYDFIKQLVNGRGITLA